MKKEIKLEVITNGVLKLENMPEDVKSAFIDSLFEKYMEYLMEKR
mgnify:CR=1 FL=1